MLNEYISSQYTLKKHIHLQRSLYKMFKYVCLFALLAVASAAPEPKAALLSTPLVAHVDPYHAAYSAPYSTGWTSPYSVQAYGYRSAYHGAVHPYSGAYGYAPYAAQYPGVYNNLYKSAYGYNPIYNPAYGYNAHHYVY